MEEFTSEFVGRGHPDKVCDQISDAVLDACLKQDPNSRVALETCIKAGEPNERFSTTGNRWLDGEKIKRGWVHLAGEITTGANISIEEIVTRTIANIGYDGTNGFDPHNCIITAAITSQSGDISRGVTRKRKSEQGAGDQGMMVGYACNETPELMPRDYVLARDLVERLRKIRENEKLPWLRPDSKSQVTMGKQLVEGKRYDNKWHIRNITIAAQHDPSISWKEVEESIVEEVVNKVIGRDESLCLDNTSIVINGTGRFVIGGPEGDSGVTGRKIVVDTYGSRARHGGGAFSGKDPSKVDRSAPYFARHVAKSIVAADLARECEVTIAYTIGQAEPNFVKVRTFKTGRLKDEELAQKVLGQFDFGPGMINKYLRLRRPIYEVTASGGHFGRKSYVSAGIRYFPWEKVVELKF